jgi:hypothetical protein
MQIFLSGLWLSLSVTSGSGLQATHAPGLPDLSALIDSSFSLGKH